MAEEGGIKQIAYPVVTILAFLVAGYLLYSNFTSTPIKEMSDSSSSASPFACSNPSCGWTGMLTARQMAEQQKKGMEVGRAGDESTGQRTSMRTLKLLCPKCNTISASPASQCGDCLTIYSSGDICPNPNCPSNQNKDKADEAAPAADTGGAEEGRRRR